MRVCVSGWNSWSPKPVGAQAPRGFESFRPCKLNFCSIIFKFYLNQYNWHTNLKLRSLTYWNTKHTTQLGSLCKRAAKHNAPMAELVDAVDSKSTLRVRVRVLPGPLFGGWNTGNSAIIRPLRWVNKTGSIPVAPTEKLVIKLNVKSYEGSSILLWYRWLRRILYQAWVTAPVCKTDPH